MSYCRWSSDNWRCDLYCYADTGGPDYVLDRLSMEINGAYCETGGSR